MHKKSSFAAALGSGFAHIQHATDKLIGWGFKKMRETTQEKDQPQAEPKKSSKHTATGKTAQNLIHAGKKALFFLGTAGEAYYEKYEELKQKDTPKAD